MLSTDGKLLTSIGDGSEGSGNNQFSKPMSVSVWEDATAKECLLFITDCNNSRVQVALSAFLLCLFAYPFV